MNSRFLIVDDNQVFAETLARSITRRGHETCVARSGDEALALAQQTPFGYITLDLHLEQDSGLHWIAALRQAAPQARILILTGYASIATTVHAMKLGADNYLAKPANLDAIFSALQCDVGGAELPAPPVTPDRGALSVERLEWEHIQRVLADHQGNISSTARALNMHRRTLQRKLLKRPSVK